MSNMGGISGMGGMHMAHIGGMTPIAMRGGMSSFPSMSNIY